MKEHKSKKFLCISGANAEEFQAKMNAAIADLKDPEITFPPSLPFTAYVVADEWTRVAECRCDQHIIDGDTYVCGACPFFEYMPDMRRRWHFCTRHQDKKRDDSPACEEFYMLLDRGTIEPRKRKED